MPQTPGKRGLPRKYDTPEEKAKREAVAKRARRRLQKPLAHGDIRFRIYVPPLMQSLPSSPLQNTRSDFANSLNNPPDVGASASGPETPTSSTDTTAAR
ncbi:hypothetical protein NW761_015048 [Fusarium oxysporum]|nr:hypothetical protein FOFC_02274 [Fusarium oxysporum]KAJ4016146.1 hypothetical protein NW758_015101 [Fusarium oxysporum]KAJ4070943.1 hypothetical protein NW761_015048 [Fusarium oxysporum]KAJ4131198.1 hypothetical protein NW765_017090 [Fusarium oxysporum]KAJ4255962.1 hypothetical protein NW764_016336 [Fusarium oxysporum]